MPKPTGQIAYETGTEFMLANHMTEDLPDGGFAGWETLGKEDRGYWEAIGRAVAAAPLSDIRRFELIDLTGRCLVLLGIPTSTTIQDEGGTLKVFVATNVSEHWGAQNETALSAEPELEALKDAVKALAECGRDGPRAEEAYRDLLKKAGL